MRWQQGVVGLACIRGMGCGDDATAALDPDLDGGLDADGGGRAGRSGGGGSGGAQTGNVPEQGPTCLVSDSVAEISVASIDKIDLLFVVDNSGSMREEQSSLRDQFPRLIRALTGGDRDGDGMQDMPVARNLHLGVVSSDLGLVGIQDIDGCEGHGDDGLLQHASSPAVTGCQASYPPFLGFTAGVNEPEQLANDFACIASLGTDGCGFEQPLESGLKALWPSVDPMAMNGQNRIMFLADVMGFGALGHGDRENAGFVRNDPAQGLSVLAIVVVTDEEDCSSRDTSHFTPAHLLDPNDPLAMQDLNLRCFFNPGNLFPLERYVNGFKALRPGAENTVIFAAIAGVPPDLTTPEAYAAVDWSNEAARNGFYERILRDPRMVERPDPARTPGTGNLVPSCNTDRGTAFPPLRILQVARGFGANGTIHSICQSDLAPAIDAVVETIAAQLGTACFPRPLVRNADGVVGCDLLWELPAPGAASASTPTSCDAPGFPFLLPRDEGQSSVGDRGGQICRVQQLAVRDDEVLPTDGMPDGWYYDDFSQVVHGECPQEQQQRIAFTPQAEPPTGVAVRLECLTEHSTPMSSCSAGPESAAARAVGKRCLPDVVPEDGFQASEAYLETSSPDCADGVCLVYRLQGDPREGCIFTPPTPDGDPGRTCATPVEVEQRVYCSCRCDAPDGFDECECPDDYSCVTVLEQGGPAVRGGYCVRNGF